MNDYARAHSDEIQQRIDRTERFRGEAQFAYTQQEDPEDRADRLYHEEVDRRLEMEERNHE